MSAKRNNPEAARELKSLYSKKQKAIADFEYGVFRLVGRDNPLSYPAAEEILKGKVARGTLQRILKDYENLRYEVGERSAVQLAIENGDREIS